MYPQESHSVAPDASLSSHRTAWYATEHTYFHSTVNTRKSVNRYVLHIRLRVAIFYSCFVSGLHGQMVNSLPVLILISRKWCVLHSLPCHQPAAYMVIHTVFRRRSNWNEMEKHISIYEATSWIYVQLITDPQCWILKWP